MVNDLGGGAESVTREIVEEGGEARTFVGSVTDAAAMQKMIDDTLERWHRIDILVNNAGILRDKTFAKISLDDFRLVVEVHLMGARPLHQGSLADDAQTELWADRYDDVFFRPLRQFWPIQLRSGQKRRLLGRIMMSALEGAEIHIRVNCLGADCGHADAARHSAPGATGTVAA